MTCLASFDIVPQEVLEHIALFIATENFLGPPAAIVPLLLTSRRVHSRLSITSNQHLYARIFAHKFDLVPAIRRLGTDRTTPDVLAFELQRRCGYLKYMRSTLGTKTDKGDDEGLSDRDDKLRGLLFHAYLMMLENEGKNEQQLRLYARVDGWLKHYWFAEDGASRACQSIRLDQWPSNTQEMSLAMWLFWFLLRPVDYPKDDEMSWTALNILKVLALAAHKYELAFPSWVDFVPEVDHRRPEYVTYYAEPHQLVVPPLATPAILSFLTLANQMDGRSYSMPLTPSHAATLSQHSHEWECEWGRCLSLGQGEYDRILTDSFRPGSIEGVWEGLFTYTEFTAYAALLAGAPPPILQKSIVVRHRQTWKLREHHLVASDPSRSDSGIELESDNAEPLPAGDPLRSYFPTGMTIEEQRDGIEIRQPGSKEAFQYQRAHPPSPQWDPNDTSKPYVQDIIITGEGHSAWGQFNLIGRVRPCDGFVSLSKEYVDGDRGKWLYRGYLVGSVNGNLAGRWRDTLSPADVLGYEGCFTMSRRR